MSQALPHLLTLDALGAGGRPLHALKVPTLNVPTPGEVVVTGFFLVLILTQGQGRASHVEPVDMHGGDVHLVPAGRRIQLLSAGALEGWLIGFEPRLLETFGKQVGLDRVGTESGSQAMPGQSLLARGFLRLRPDQARWRRIDQLAEAMEREVASGAWGRENAARALLVLLLTELFRELQEHAPRAPLTVSGTAYDALAFVERHCLERVSLRDVAASVHRTPSHVATVVKRETGLTVGEWLREHRMVEARRRLLGGDESVESIAGDVGYADVTHFIRTFKSLHGMTPNAWRHQRRQTAGN